MIQSSRTVRRVLAVLFAALACAAAYGAGEDRWGTLASPVFGHRTSLTGLPTNTLSAIAQGGDGFIWIGTQSGLVRFDGYRYRSFNYDSRDPHSLPSDFVQTLYTDVNGNLWVGTATGGLARFDREHENFIRYGEGADGQSARSVTAIVGDGATGLWIGTEHELEHRDIQSGELQRYPQLAADLGRASDMPIVALHRGDDGWLWIGTDAGLARWHPGAAHAALVPIQGAAHGPTILDNISAFAEDSRGTLWFGTASHGIGAIGSDGQARLFEGKGAEGSELAHQSVHAILEISPRVLWLMTYGGGVFALDLNDDSIRHYRHLPALSQSLGDDQCLDAIKDRSGLIWIATEQGVSTADPANRAFQTAFGESGMKDGLDEGNVTGVLVDRADRLWTGYHGGGLSVFDSDGRRVASLRPGANAGSGLPSRSVNALAETSDGAVWIGTSSGLYVTDRLARHATHVPMPLASTSPFVQVLEPAPDGLWVGANQGLLHLRLKDHQWTVFEVHRSDLSDNRITSFASIGDGQMWVGTLRGLNRIDAQGRVLEKILADAGQHDALGNDYVTDLAIDAKGRLWIATGGDGLYLLAERDPTGRPVFKHVGLAEGLGNANLSALEIDRAGNVWTSTDAGLARTDPETLRARAYRRGDGVVITSYWNNAGAITAHGDLVFGGIGGIAIVHPDGVRSREFRPPVVVTDIRFGGVAVPSMRFNHADAGAPLLVTPDRSSFSVEFSALDFSAPLENRYTYRLDGFDRDWIASDALHRTAAYTNLSPGSYHLQVRGSGRDGIWSPSELSLPISVVPAWYQSWPVRTLEAVAALLALLLIVRARTAYLHIRQAELEALVQLRTEELSESKKRLEEIAFYDPLTGLPNRRFFSERFDQFRATSERSKEPFGLVLIDLDYFKQVNDQHGHFAGDQVLIETAKRLKTATREIDSITRLGGDEFALLLATVRSETIVGTVCERVISTLARPVTLGTVEYSIRATLGVALFPEHGTTQEALYKAADAVLYEAKAAGRNTWRLARITPPSA